MEIRAENYQDYNAVAELNFRAFGNRLVEPLVVTFLRTWPQYEPALSLVAVEAGQLIGHALFMPYTVLVEGQEVAAVNLAPIAVDPAYQKKGVGTALIQAGHVAALARGYKFSFLIGHPDYYPRLGYLPHAYGGSSVKIALSDLAPAPEGQLEARPILPSDAPALLELWRQNESQVSFTPVPSSTFLDWISPNPEIASVAYWQNGQLVAYARYPKAKPLAPKIFLAANEATAQLLLRELHQAAGSPPEAVLKLPLHPDSLLGAYFAKGDWDSRTWQVCMVCPLAPSAFDTYYTRLQAGQTRPGWVNWGVAFDFE